MIRKLIAGAAAAFALTTFVFAQGGRPASPAGTAATEIGGKYDPKPAEPSYQGGKWIENLRRPTGRGESLRRVAEVRRWRNPTRRCGARA
jgi:hypothetical protein